VVEDLRTLGSTNLWDGLRLGMDQLKSKEGSNLSSLLLFTDGLPNVDPPKGYVQMLQEYKDKYPECDCIINMFGFGNSLDSALLDNLAIEGNGSFVFYSRQWICGYSVRKCFKQSFSDMGQSIKNKFRTT